jgi:hypothetical protein
VTDKQPSPSEQAQQFIARYPWVTYANLLTRLSLLAAAGTAALLLIVPGAAAAPAAWIALTTALAFRVYRAFDVRRGEGPPPPGTWQPGEPPPEGIPDATAEAAGRILAQAAAAGRWRGGWMAITPCENPVRHGRCQDAYSLASDGMIGVILGEHIAARPVVASFALAHEVRHQAPWNRHVKILADRGRLAGWLAGRGMGGAVAVAAGRGRRHPSRPDRRAAGKGDRLRPGRCPRGGL